MYGKSLNRGVKMIERVEILVYFNHRSDTRKTIEELGATIQYLNKKAGYAVLYVDKDNVGSVTSGLKRMKGFKRYDVSETDLLSLDIN